MPGRRKRATVKSSSGSLAEGRGRRLRPLPDGRKPVRGSRQQVENLPSDYALVLKDIKARVQRERLRIVLAANSAMVQLYWDIGRVILDRQHTAGWGARIIDRLSQDLCRAFPDQRGFSSRNLKYMRAFAAAWSDGVIVQRLVAQLPWRQNIALLEQLEHPDERQWYAEQAIRNGWSQSVLILQIRNQAHRRHSRAVNNFDTTLPPADSDLAGRQVRLEVANEDFYIDLLFYHLKLRRYVVIELKATAFDPGFVGQLNLSLSAVDDLLRHEDDKPTIGLLLCQSKNQIVVEYALRHLQRPIGVAEWETRLVEQLPDDLKGSLPSIEEIDAELESSRER